MYVKTKNGGILNIDNNTLIESNEFNEVVYRDLHSDTEIELYDTIEDLRDKLLGNLKKDKKYL